MVYCLLKVNMKPEGNRILEGPSCSWEDYIDERVWAGFIWIRMETNFELT